MYRKSLATISALVVCASFHSAFAQRQRPAAQADQYAPGLPVVDLGSTAPADIEKVLPPSFCVNPVLPNTGGTSTNARCPIARFAGARAHYLITAAEMAAAGYPSGSTVTSIGWRYSVAPNQIGNANLNLYLENTSDTTNTKSADWATAISTMTQVHTGTTALPNAVGAFDITLSGPTTFTYTGGSVYVAFDWGPYAGTLATAGTIICNTNLVGGLKGINSQAASGLAVSDFRPETRFGGDATQNDVAVTYVYSMGQLPFCALGTQIIKATVVNKGGLAQASVPVTLTVTGADSFTDTQSTAALAICSGTETVTFAVFAPNINTGTDTLTVSVPSDDRNFNNSLARTFVKTSDEYSYKIPGTNPTGGVGLTAANGALVAKFNSSSATTVTHVKLEFAAPSATTYRVAIYGDNGSGAPAFGTVMAPVPPIYLDAADRTVPTAMMATYPYSELIDIPDTVVPAGNFYVGVLQTNATNCALSYDAETPLRTGQFFVSGAANPPVAAWTDLGPANAFKMNIGCKVTACPLPVGSCCVSAGNCQANKTQAECAALNPDPAAWHVGQDCTACPSAPPCPGDIATPSNGAVDTDDLLVVIGSWGACFGTCPPSCVADIAVPHNCAVDTDDLLVIVGSWGGCPQ